MIKNYKESFSLKRKRFKNHIYNILSTSKTYIKLQYAYYVFYFFCFQEKSAFGNLLIRTMYGLIFQNILSVKMRKLAY